MNATRTVDALPLLEHPLEEGWTLSAGWYTEPHVLELERRHIFTRAWM